MRADKVRSGFQLGVVHACLRVRRRGRLGQLAALTAAFVGIVTTALFTSGAPARAAGPNSTALPPAPIGVSAGAYSGGRAFVSWTAGSGGESDSYHVEKYLVTGGTLSDQGGSSVAGFETVVSGLSAGSVYVFDVSALNPSGQSYPAVTAPMTAVGLLVPQAPAGVTLSSDGVDNQLSLSWTPSSAAPAAEHFKIGVFEGSGSGLQQVGAVSCDAPCSSRIIQASPGSVTSVDVSASNGVGNSAYTWSNSVQVPQPCALACVAVASGSSEAAFNDAADGFLVPAGAADAGSLSPTQFRTNAVTLTTMTPAQVADMKSAAVTEVLSDDWLQSHNVGGYALLPWANWTVYSTWVKAEVTTVKALAAAKGVSISYWEVQNEPFGGSYYSSSSEPPASETVSVFENQFLTAYSAIKAADPNAQVIGPSLISFAANPSDVATGIDIRTFLDFCVFNNIRLAAVTFHDNNFTGSSEWYEPDRAPAAQPAEVQDHVNQLRQLIAERPSLGNPLVLVNEYGDPYTFQLPGWDVGRIAALDGARVDGANRSCWGNCGASLDGLLSNDGQSTLPGYWVYSFLSEMRGMAVPVASSYTDVTGVASVNSAGQIQVLVGRHQSCNRLSSIYCPVYQASQATVSVQVPNASTAQVTMAAIPLGSTLSAPLTSLNPTTLTEPVVNGSMTLTTPSLSDGDAVEITVVPAN